MKRTFADFEAFRDLIADIAVIAESDEQRNESQGSEYNNCHKNELLFSSVLFVDFHFSDPNKNSETLGCLKRLRL